MIIVLLNVLTQETLFHTITMFQYAMGLFERDNVNNCVTDFEILSKEILRQSMYLLERSPLIHFR